MTPKIIELKQAPVVLVELPEIPLNVWDTHANGFMYNDEAMYLESFYLYGICEDSKLIGILSDLTEEQFAECVADNGNGDCKNYVGAWGGFEKAKDSFYSLLESERVYMENPYAIPNPKDYNTKINEYWILEKKWQEAQSRTIDPARTVVLIRKEDK